MSCGGGKSDLRILGSGEIESGGPGDREWNLRPCVGGIHGVLFIIPLSLHTLSLRPIIQEICLIHANSQFMK